MTTRRRRARVPQPRPAAHHALRRRATAAQAGHPHGGGGRRATSHGAHRLDHRPRPRRRPRRRPNRLRGHPGRPGRRQLHPHRRAPGRLRRPTGASVDTARRGSSFSTRPPWTDQRCCRCHEHRNLPRKRRLRVVDAGHEAPDRAPKHEHYTGDTGIFRMSLPKYRILRSITLITRVILNSRITYRLPVARRHSRSTPKILQNLLFLPSYLYF